MHAYYVDFGAFWYIKSNIICVQRTSLYSLKKKKNTEVITSLACTFQFYRPPPSVRAMSLHRETRINKGNNPEGDVRLICLYRAAPQLHTTRTLQPYVLFGYPLVMSTRILRMVRLETTAICHRWCLHTGAARASQRK